MLSGIVSEAVTSAMSAVSHITAPEQSHVSTFEPQFDSLPLQSAAPQPEHQQDSLSSQQPVFPRRISAFPQRLPPPVTPQPLAVPREVPLTFNEDFIQDNVAEASQHTLKARTCLLSKHLY